MGGVKVRCPCRAEVEAVAEGEFQPESAPRVDPDAEVSLAAFEDRFKLRVEAIAAQPSRRDSRRGQTHRRSKPSNRFQPFAILFLKKSRCLASARIIRSRC